MVAINDPIEPLLDEARELGHAVVDTTTKFFQSKGQEKLCLPIMVVAYHTLFLSAISDMVDIPIDVLREMPMTDLKEITVLALDALAKRGYPTPHDTSSQPIDKD